MMRERRTAPRYQLGIPGRLHPSGEMVGTKVQVQMISAQGCAIEGAEGLDFGRKCELYISWQGSEIGAEAQVVSKDAKGGIGLKFLTVDKDIRRRLAELCDTLRTESLSSPLEREMDKALVESATERRPTPATKPTATATAPSARVRERRRVPRYVSEMRARLLDPATGTSSRVRLITLSVLGGCLEGSDLPSAGQKYEVSTEWEGKPLRISAEIVWNSKGTQVGLRFAALDAETENLLRRVCSNLRIQPMTPLPPEPQ
jgi:hypothetical protein